MATHKYIGRICAAGMVLCLLLTLLFMNGERFGMQAAASGLGYEERLFDPERVHTIDIVMDDWEGFLETCESEEYTQCALVIDGEAYRNTGIRAKGNTSLSMVSAMDSDRYSFKLEFDHYDSGGSYYGLDKVSLNNLIQDTTCMKDYLTYRMMGAFGVDAPLCSYVYLTVNGQDWGLYLAVEGVEDAFLRRNYGTNPGTLYKPDSMSFGGGRGNGREFSMGDFMDGGEAARKPADFSTPPEGGFPSGGRGGPGGGMGSDDVKLRYIDDDPDSYSNIFQNAKTEINDADQARLIASLKALSEGERLEEVLDIEEVLRYFVVHNFVCNGDSYTGSMVHNYYLHEKDGRLSMIPWDYNLAYGTFQSNDASGAVNAPIDTPVDGGDSRPMSDWMFADPAYTALYHQYFQEFLETVDIAGLIGGAAALIAPYVEKDPTAFYTYAEFETGVETLRTFCRLRAESAAGQLDGTIPSTAEGQAEDSGALIDASGVTLSDMGTMNRGGGSMDGGDPPAFSSESSQGRPAAFLRPPDSGTEPVNIPTEGPPEMENGNPDFAFPGKNGGFPGPDGETAATGNSLLLTAASTAVLLAGILFAAFYRRRGTPKTT